MNEETKIIETPIDGHKVEIKSWITGYEKRELNKVIFEQVQLAGGETKIEDLKPVDLMEKTENASIKIVVVSVNGKTDNILDEILKMKAGDYEFVIGEVNKVSRETDFLARRQTL